MATKNLVPRANNEGELGISTRKWKGINAVTGSFEELRTNELLNASSEQLLFAGPGVTITPEDGKITIAATSASDAQVDKIFAGPTIDNVVQEYSLVQTFHDASVAENNKIVFKTNNAERWFIDKDGHLIPKVDSSGNSSPYNLGSLDARVNAIYVENDGINFKSHLHPQIQTGLNVTTKQKLQFGIFNSSINSFDYDNVLIAKEDVKVASTSPLINLIQSTTNTNVLKLYQSDNTTVETAITIDSIVLANDDRVLIKDFTGNDMIKNGIYTVSGVGTGVTLTRIETLNNADDFSDIKVTVLEGTENGHQIFLTVPDVNAGVRGSAVGVNPMKWVRVSGGGGLKAVVEDLAPKLGGKLDLNGKRIFNNGNTIRVVANNDSDGNGGISISESLLAGVNLLRLSDNDKDNVLEFKRNDTGHSLKLYGTSQENAYALTGNVNFYFQPLTTEYEDATNHVDAVIATRAWASSQFLDNSVAYATESFVTSQGYLTAHQSLTNYIQTNDAASLTSLTLTNTIEAQNSWSDNNAVTKSYVTNLIQGISKVLEPARVAIKSNVALDTLKENLQVNTTSQVTLSSGDRVLLAGQTDPIQNGVYLIATNGVGQGGAATERVTDLAASDQAAGTFIFIEEGDSAESGFICAAPSTADTVGTHDLSFFKMSGIANTSVTNTSALTLANNALSVNVDGTTIEKINDPATTNPLNNQILRVKEIPVDKLVLGGANSDVTISSDLLPELNAETVNESKFNIDDVSDTATNLADADKFIIYDDDSTATPKTAKITALNIDKYVRNNLNDVSGDIRLTFEASGSTHGTLEAKVHHELYDNRVEKSDVTDSNGTVTRDGIVDEDLLLIKDSISTDQYGRTVEEFQALTQFVDGGGGLDATTGLNQTAHNAYRAAGHQISDEAKIKKVKYSTLREKIAASVPTGLDINGLPAIDNDSLDSLDELALFNMPPSSDVDRVLSPVRVHAVNRADLSVSNFPNTDSWTGHQPKAVAGATVIDGITLQAGDRVLVSFYNVNSDQAKGNGIWVVPASGNQMTRSTDLSNGTIFNKSFVQVLEGTQYANKGYILLLNRDDTGQSTVFSSPGIGTGYMKVSLFDQVLENKKVTVGQLSDVVRRGISNYEVVEPTDSTVTLTVKSNKHYLLISPALGGPNTKYILKFYNDGTSGNGFEQPELGDVIRFSVLSRSGSNLQVNSPTATVECQFSSNSSIHLNNKTLEKTVEFFYQKSDNDGTTFWRSTKLNSENSELMRLNTVDDPRLTYPSISSMKAQWNATESTSVYVARSIQGNDPVITLPTAAQISADHIPLGTSKKFYFTHSSPEKVTFKSDCIVIKKSGSGAGFGFAASGSLEIPLVGNFVNKVTATLIADSGPGLGWYIENASLESAGGLPDVTSPAGNKVLVYNNNTTPTLEFAKLESENIKTGEITGGTFTDSGGTFTTTGNIAKQTITGGTTAAPGNIAQNTVTKENLEQLVNNKVLGRIDLSNTPVANADTEHIDVVTQLDEFTDEDGNIFTGLDAIDKIQRFANPGKVIPTAKAVIQYIENRNYATISDVPLLSSRTLNAVINDSSIATSGAAQLTVDDKTLGARIQVTGTFRTNTADGANDGNFNNPSLTGLPWIINATNARKAYSITNPSFRSSYINWINPATTSSNNPYGKFGMNAPSLYSTNNYVYPSPSGNSPHYIGFYNKYGWRNFARILLPPADSFYQTYGDGASITFQYLPHQNYIDGYRHGFILQPHQDDLQYTNSHISQGNFNSNSLPTFMMQEKNADRFPTSLNTMNKISEFGYIGVSGDTINYIPVDWTSSESFIFKANLFKLTNLRLVFVTSHGSQGLASPQSKWQGVGGHSSLQRTQPNAYMWVLEKI